MRTRRNPKPAAATNPGAESPHRDPVVRHERQGHLVHVSASHVADPASGSSRGAAGAVEAYVPRLIVAAAMKSATKPRVST